MFHEDSALFLFSQTRFLLVLKSADKQLYSYNFTYPTTCPFNVSVNLAPPEKSTLINEVRSKKCFQNSD